MSAVLILALFVPLLDPHPALGAADPGFKPETRELLPYGATGFRYLVIGSNALPPKGWETSGFSDWSWKTGTAGFGSSGFCPDPAKLYCNPPACALQHAVGTVWQPNSRLLLRRKVKIPQGATSVRLLVAVDNDVIGVFLNGKAVPGYHYHEGCPTRDQFRFDIPSALVKPGMNLLAVQMQDRGGESFADVSLLADFPMTAKTVPVCSPKQIWTWKFIHDQQQGLAGKDVAGHRIGSYPAERTFLSIDTWFPRSGYKETLCGQLHHFNFYHSGIGNEDDWNNYLLPNLSHQTLLFEPVDSDSQAVFAQLDVQAHDKVKLVFAGRWDDSSLHDSQVSPKASLVYKVNPNHTLRLTYNEAFQVANDLAAVATTHHQPRQGR